MFCYKDKTFCINENCKGIEHDKLTDKVKNDAQAWWGFGKGQPPIIVADLCGVGNNENDSQ